MKFIQTPVWQQIRKLLENGPLLQAASTMLLVSEAHWLVVVPTFLWLTTHTLSRT